MKQAYLVLDIGTGNVRSAVVTPSGEILSVERADIIYHRDTLFPDSIFFKPDELLDTLKALTRKALSQAGEVKLLAVTSTSQREGIVLISKTGKALIGMPNIDHRGREWEDAFGDKGRVYALSGRYPTSLFSVFKLIGIREKRSELWQEAETFLSISDWALWALSGVAVYEHSQASETLLYDVAAGSWSPELCSRYGIAEELLSPLRSSGEVVGEVKADVAADWGLGEHVKAVVGGGDTQMAIKSTRPHTGDVILVSGTTTPVVKLEGGFLTDDEQRTWTSRDIEVGRFVFEANAGVTGLNYQRLKEVFYPNESYDVIEKELSENLYDNCVGSLGSLIASEKSPVTTGGFVFHVPVTHELKRSSFVWASLVDIAFSIVENYKVLAECAGHRETYLWACGGGLQSATLRQLIADMTGKEVRVRSGFEQATVIGSALHCNDALGLPSAAIPTDYLSAKPQTDKEEYYKGLYSNWAGVRTLFRKQGEVKL
ncbi:FGGY-family carbohydrate kinase [Leadbetterella sp. DM7]|uniref:FGGY-family carbohydrate kinase n=1 Tax=Leadbetterella sp. DM7 TaxID=3235085 RepID=UPI00349EDE82